MVRITLPLIAGVLLLQHFSVLPPWWAVLPVLGVTGLLWLVTGLGFPFLVVLGLAFAGWHGASALEGRLPQTLSGGEWLVTGTVAGLPEDRHFGTRFLFDVEVLEGEGADRAVSAWRGRVRLSWRTPPPRLEAGQRMRLRVRLYSPDGWRNPGGLDRERWFYANGIMATGYVKGDQAVETLPDARDLSYQVHRFRARVRDYLDSAGASPPASALLKALLIGDRSGLDAGQWQVFRTTGTSHLVAISGLHIGLVAGAVLLAFGRLWRLSARLCTLWPARRAAAVAAFVAALGYAALAGFSVPTQRALLMLALALGALVSGRAVASSTLLAGALLLVVAADPASVLSAGTWLSFGAVALILLMVEGRRRPLGAAGAWWKIQWGLWLGLMPLLAAWGMPVSLLSPLVNLLAVPWFTLVMVPVSFFALVAAGFPGGVGSALLRADLQLAELTQAALATASDVGGDWIWYPPEFPSVLGFLGILGTVVVLSPLSIRHRLLGLVMLIPLGFPPVDKIGDGGLRLVALDVGQGLAVVIMTARHTLVYDLGPRWQSGAGAATAVVIPFLQSQGVRHVDRLIVSHDDSDHAGAWRAFIDDFDVRDVVAGQAEALGSPARQCRSGERWSWEGVNFSLHHLGDGSKTLSDNDASCILHLDGNAGVLLTGDISAAAERMLVAAHPELFPVDIVQVPHHGSRTSSSKTFVAETRARLALVSAGYQNRYGFPHPDVAERWVDTGASLVNTADLGAVIVDLPAEGAFRVRGYREMARRYWHR